MPYGALTVIDGDEEQEGIDDLHWEKILGLQQGDILNKLSVNVIGAELELIFDDAYFIFSQLSFSGTSGTEFSFAVLRNGEPTRLRASSRTPGGPSTIISVSVGGTLLASAGDKITLGVMADGAGKSITLKSGQVFGLFLGGYSP